MNNKKYPNIINTIMIVLLLGVGLVIPATAQTNPSCFAPGNLIVNDAPDVTLLPYQDIENVYIAEPIYGDNSQRLAIRLKVRNLQPDLPAASVPLGVWDVMLTNSGGTVYFVRMSTLLGSPEFTYGTVTSLLGVPVFNTLGTIQGQFSNQGFIFYNLNKNLISNPAVGSNFSVEARTYLNTVGVGLVQTDSSSSTSYTLVGNAGCNPFRAAYFGQSGDIPVVNDYNRNEADDFAVFRPNNGYWYSSDTVTDAFKAVAFGNANSGDIPVPGDYDRDNIGDYAVYRPSTGTFYALKTETNTVDTFTFGAAGDIPLSGDYDGDRIDDFALFRPSTGVWTIRNSNDASMRSVQFGVSEDLPQVGDFDGDRKADIAVFRPSSGAWYVLQSATQTARGMLFGLDGDRPVAADYDGDGKTDIAVFRPETGAWYVARSSDGTFSGVLWGLGTDRVAPGDFNGNGRADYTVFRPSTGVWYVYMN